MTSPALQVRSTASFKEHLEILAEELELAVKWQRPCILLAVYGSDFVRADAEAALKNRLLDLGQRILHLSVRDRSPKELRAFFREFKNPRRTVFVIDGFRRPDGEDTKLYATLSLQREYFIERRIRTVFWLTRKEIVQLAHAAPEFWAHRHCVVEFVESPKKEQVLAQTMEAAWQSAGALATEVEDTEAGIEAREALLTDLPDAEESLSMRGNLLLSTSILNWRKGEYEKADELLQEALKIATKIQDNRFEAECFNALALIRSSTQRLEDAIEAYKRAIHLAPDQVRVWNNLGSLCSRIGRNDEAMIAFRKALQANPQDGIAWNGLAAVHFQLGYPQDAAVAYRKAIQYAPGFAQPWCGLGDVYGSIGSSDEAEKSYRKAIDLDKRYAAPWIRLGALLKRQASFHEAEKAYQQAVSLDSGNSAVWNDLGSVQLESGSLDEAASAFTKAIDMDHSNGWAYANLALVYMRQGKHKEAVSLLLRSIELLESNGDKAASWNRLASVYRALNDYDNAVAAYQMADELASLDEPSLEDQVGEPTPASGTVEPAPAAPVGSSTGPASEPIDAAVSAPVATMDAAEEIHSDSRASTETDPDNEAVADAPAWLFKRASQQEARESGPMAAVAAAPVGPAMSAVEGEGSGNLSGTQATPELKDAPQPEAECRDASDWTARGNACFQRGDLEEAIAAYNAAIQLDGSYGAAYGNLALTYLTQGQFAEAILLYQRSIELLSTDQDKAVSWNGLGNAYRCLGDYAHAVEAYQRAAELDPETGGMRDRADESQSSEAPNDARAWMDLGEVLLRTGSAEKASEAFRKAIQVDPLAGAAHCGLARALSSQGRHREAVPLFQRSIELLDSDKDKADALNGLGNAYRKLNDYESAIRSYRKAVVLTDDGANLLTRTRLSLLSNVYVNP